MNALTIIGYIIIFIGIPLAVILFFLISLIRLCMTPRDDPKYGGRKAAFIVAAVLAALLILAVVAMMILITLAMNHM